ncbi:MAG: site-2 protease family protein [Bacteroidota bacterium]
MDRPPGFDSTTSGTTPPPPPDRTQPDRDRVGLHLGLALLTFASMVVGGGFLVGRAAAWPLLPEDASATEALLALFTSSAFLHDGLFYAVPFFLFLTVHEFGHYIAARVRGLKVSLPYYIPIPFPGPTIGTLGAVIRIKEPLRRTTQLFDVGASGPLAGFVIALGVLGIALATLPDIEYLRQWHPDEVDAFLQTGRYPPFDPEALLAVEGAQAILFGDTLLFRFLNGLGAYRVPAEEIMHYPMLLAGWLGLFFTALNLLPVGQLDGGHVVYTLFGPAVHRILARVTTVILLLSGGLGYATAPPFPISPTMGWLTLALIYGIASWRLFEKDVRLTLAGTLSFLVVVALTVAYVPGIAEVGGYWAWLLWVGLILFLIGVDHPPVLIPEPLGPRRRALGFLCLLIFVLCFSIQPIQFYG